MGTIIILGCVDVAAVPADDHVEKPLSASPKNFPSRGDQKVLSSSKSPQKSTNGFEISRPEKDPAGIAVLVIIVLSKSMSV